MAVGSPPHMRGKDPEHSSKLFCTRITPAHAGKSTEEIQSQLDEKDHPRTCGEKLKAYKSPSSNRGSPPHMRGKVYKIATGDLDEGITPAHAGKRDFQFLYLQQPEDHPRTCGEKLKIVFFLLLPWGSPPHMRGKAFASACIANELRITPAHAGKSAEWNGTDWAWWDHPRTCGEKLLSRVRSTIKKGSPPHMRGKGTLNFPFSFLIRITPAHAGKRLQKQNYFFFTQDHPRTCGEKVS